MGLCFRWVRVLDLTRHVCQTESSQLHVETWKGVSPGRLLLVFPIAARCEAGHGTAGLISAGSSRLTNSGGPCRVWPDATNAEVGCACPRFLGLLRSSRSASIALTTDPRRRLLKRPRAGLREYQYSRPLMSAYRHALPSIVALSAGFVLRRVFRSAHGLFSNLDGWEGHTFS
jgi:hypothetical protein